MAFASGKAMGEQVTPDFLLLTLQNGFSLALQITEGFFYGACLAFRAIA